MSSWELLSFPSVRFLSVGQASTDCLVWTVLDVIDDVSTAISDVDDTFFSVLAMIFGYSCYLCDLVRRNSRKSTSLSDDEKFLMDSLGRSSKVSDTIFRASYSPNSLQ